MGQPIFTSGQKNRVQIRYFSSQVRSCKKNLTRFAMSSANQINRKNSLDQAQLKCQVLCLPNQEPYLLIDIVSQLIPHLSKGLCSIDLWSLFKDTSTLSPSLNHSYTTKVGLLTCYKLHIYIHIHNNYNLSSLCFDSLTRKEIYMVIY